MMMTMMKKNMKRKITKIFKCKNKIKSMRMMKKMRKMMRIINWRLKLKEILKLSKIWIKMILSQLMSELLMHIGFRHSLMMLSKIQFKHKS